MKNLVSIIFAIFVFFVFCQTGGAATLTVTKAADTDDGVCNADCSLREAVATANSGDTVIFSHQLIGQILTLVGDHIVIDKNLTIDGILGSANVAFVSGGNTTRIFYVEEGRSLTVKNMIIGQGRPASLGNVGGAIYSRPNSFLSVSRVAFRGNYAAFGGAIYAVGGGVHLINSSFTGNRAEAGFAVLATVNADLYMANVTATGNSQIPNSNQLGAAVLVTSTSQAAIRNSTVAKNSATGFDSKGGILVSQSSLNIGNSIVAENSSANSAKDIAGSTIVSAGGNLIGDMLTSDVPPGTFTLPGDQTDVNPLIAPEISSTQWHPVAVHPLQAGSPAINGGLTPNAVDPLTNQPLTTDGRGGSFARNVGGVDKGAFEDQTNGNSLIVTKKTNSDDNVCDLDCSLREAVKAAGLDAGEDTITFLPSVFGEINLGGEEIDITGQSVNIIGNSVPDSIIISGENQSRIFYISGVSAVTLQGLTLANGNGTGFPMLNSGGAIFATNEARSLTLDRVIVRNNSANLFGAIRSGAEVTRISNSTVNANQAESTLAIYIPTGAFYMTNTTVSGNTDSNGGFSYGAVTILGQPARIHNSTIAYNRTADGAGGGIICESGCNLALANTIVAENIAADGTDIRSIDGGLSSLGGNLIGSTSGFPAGIFDQPNDATGISPMLAPLADNGGDVPTHLLQPGSPALNAGINANAVDPFDLSVLIYDARGEYFNRIVNGTVDKGAFESLIPTAARVSVSGRVLVNGRGLSRAEVFYIDSNGQAHSAVTNTFGFYHFENVAVGETYIFQASSKEHSFSPQIVTVNDEIKNLNFLSQ